MFSCRAAVLLRSRNKTPGGPSGSVFGGFATKRSGSTPTERRPPHNHCNGHTSVLLSPSDVGNTRGLPPRDSQAPPAPPERFSFTESLTAFANEAVHANFRESDVVKPPPAVGGRRGRRGQLNELPYARLNECIRSQWKALSAREKAWYRRRAAHTTTLVSRRGAASTDNSVTPQQVQDFTDSTEPLVTAYLTSEVLADEAPGRMLVASGIDGAASAERWYRALPFRKKLSVYCETLRFATMLHRLSKAAAAKDAAPATPPPSSDTEKSPPRPPRGLPSELFFLSEVPLAPHGGDGGGRPWSPIS